MTETLFNEPKILVTRKPRIRLEGQKIRLQFPGDEEDPLHDLHSRKLACVICGGDAWLVGHHNTVIDWEKRTARIDGTAHAVCYGHRARLKGLHSYGPTANVTDRDWGNLSVATALVRALDKEAGHG